MSSPLIETQALGEILDQPGLVILDSSWHLPAAGRDAKNEYQACHIPGARFFDIDATSDQGSELPHMLPPVDEFEMAMGNLGINNASKIVVYDSMGITSAARAWWTLLVFGHEDVSVLNGGLAKWQAEHRPVTDANSAFKITTYTATFHSDMVAQREDLERNLDTGVYRVLDARSHGRFTAEEPEPRQGLAGGHIPGSTSLPFTELLDGPVMKSTKELQTLLADIQVNGSAPIITSCGSGVTAAVITLALKVAGLGMHKLYDGSWTEWGGLPDTPKATR